MHGLGLGLAWLGLGGCTTMSTQLDPTGDGPCKTPPAGLEPAIFGLEVRRLVH
jgi:hypothetical protein